MDIATIVGIISGIGLIVSAILIGSSITLFIDIPSLLIVLGGTAAAILIAYPLNQVLGVMGFAMKVFMFKLPKQDELIAQLVDISNKARKGGLLSIEGDIASITDPFLSKALQMTVDGVGTGVIASIMQKQIMLSREQHKIGSDLFSSMGSYCPAFGMIGTLIGLVQMMAALDDPSTIGPKMSVALITTFYGSLFANLFYIPMSDKLKKRSGEETQNMTLLYEGVISIREGEHPRLMEDKLNVYLTASGKAPAPEK